jgi:hypothetical protein
MFCSGVIFWLGVVADGAVGLSPCTITGGAEEAGGVWAGASDGASAAWAQGAMRSAALSALADMAASLRRAPPPKIA